MNHELIAICLLVVSVASGIAGALLLSARSAAPSQERLDAPVDKSVADKAKDL